MGYEKLIDLLRNNNIENNCHDCALGYYAFEAATALSTLQAENEKLRAELEQVKQERDAAVGDMEALMWYSGEGCQICANAVEVHKRPYVRLDCKLGSGIDCKPKWRGKKED